MKVLSNRASSMSNAKQHSLLSPKRLQLLQHHAVLHVHQAQHGIGVRSYEDLRSAASGTQNSAVSPASRLKLET